jgi:carbamoyl-phosphate synthase small subunit
MTAKLVLENGLLFEGESFGFEGETGGEMVFNTSMSGYQEILTDPSYCGQIVTMTCPMIGNYGVNPEDMESGAPQVSGLVVKEYSEYFSNYRATESLGSWLRTHRVVAIQGVDTRRLTRVIREEGAMRAVLSTVESDDAVLLERARSLPSMNGLDLASRVSTRTPYRWEEQRRPSLTLPAALEYEPAPGQQFHVVVYDYGVKRNILRRLATYGCRMTVVPSRFSADEVLALNPDGVFLSNGPGDPAAVQYAVENLKRLVEKTPMFGICLGHQLLALALGGRTFKMKFGHRGANHPVKNLLTNRIEITSQNHGFAVDPESLDQASLEITHTNLNDGTNEGFRHRKLPIFSVQYHPEASPGPHDSDYLFCRFVEAMKEASGVPV